MPNITTSLSEFIQQLPVDVQLEVRDFAEFLLHKRQPKPRRYVRQTWAGALRDYRNDYSSLELQKKASEWRSDDVSG